MTMRPVFETNLFLTALLLVSCSAVQDGEGPQATSKQLVYDGPTLFRNRLSGACIDVIGAPGTAARTQLQTYPCESSGKDAWGGPSDQFWQWDAATGLIRNSLTPSQCLDVLGAPGTANGTPLQISDCETSGYDQWGNPTDQAWNFIVSGFIVNRLSGKCVDVSGAPGNSNHLPIVLWDCEYSGYNAGNGSATDQTWTRVSPSIATATRISIATATQISR
jgi:hypothetical protein